MASAAFFISGVAVGLSIATEVVARTREKIHRERHEAWMARHEEES